MRKKLCVFLFTVCLLLTGCTSIQPSYLSQEQISPEFRCKATIVTSSGENGRQLFLTLQKMVFLVRAILFPIIGAEDNSTKPAQALNLKKGPALFRKTLMPWR